MLEPITAKEIAIIMISLNQSASHVEAKEGGLYTGTKRWFLQQGKRVK